MKKLAIVGAVLGVLLIGAIAALGLTSSDVQAAESEDTSDHPLRENLLDRLVEEGVISEEQAEEFDEHLDDLHSRFGREFRVGPRFRSEDFELPEDFDPDQLLEKMKERFEQFDFEDLPEGLELPEDFDPKAMLEDLKERFDEGAFEDFRFRGPRLGIFGEDNPLRDAFENLDLEELEQAIEDGTVAELIDIDAIRDAVTEQVEQAVAEGVITQEQADRILERMDEKLTALENGDVGRKGRHHGFGHFRFGPKGGSDDATAEGAGFNA